MKKSKGKATVQVRNWFAIVYKGDIYSIRKTDKQARLGCFEYAMSLKTGMKNLKVIPITIKGKW